tara:strand:+ start:1727 stop:2647 length:921 start_codon:yes stop_codon:yes gene_type:complete
MSLLTQKTILNSISIKGVGVHTGSNVTLKILPAAPNNGIIFKRIDLNKNNIVIPSYSNVVDAKLCTTISNQYGVKISTIEHLMGAFYGLGIDNALVEINAQEVPIMDGSAKVFVQEIQKSGIKDSDVPIKLVKIEKKIEYNEGKKFITIDKSNVSSDIDFEIKYKNNVINIQRNKINIFEDNLEEIFNSRTFCLYEDIEKLQKLGLGIGGSLQNAIVVDSNKVLNKEGLRYENEFVNHKILDCMGDLYLSGYKVIGSLKCSQGGHSLTNKLLRKIFTDKKNYSVLEIKGKNLPHSLAEKTQLKSIA